MAGERSVSLIFKLCVVVMITSLYNDIINNILVVGEIHFEPRWNSSSACSVNTEKGIRFEGRSEETCVLQVNSSSETHVQIQIKGRTEFQIQKFPSFIYIERKGDKENCLNKFVVFDEQLETCNSIIIDTKILVYLQGNVSVFITEVPKIETVSKCYGQKNNFSTGRKESQISHCTNVKEYNKVVSCIQLSANECRIKIAPNCCATLGSREVIYKQCNYNVSENHTALMTYQIQTEVLVLSDNNIVEIRAHAFENLENFKWNCPMSIAY